MPTYTYECRKCGWTIDKFHGMSVSPRVRCKECGATCKRLIGAGSGIIFKGSGFYQTDYKRAAEPSKSGGEGESAPKSESGSTKGDSEGKKDSGSTSSGDGKKSNTKESS